MPSRLNPALISLFFQMQNQGQEDAAAQARAARVAEQDTLKQQENGLDFLMSALETNPDVNLDKIAQIPGHTVTAEALAATKELQKGAKLKAKEKEAAAGVPDLAESFARTPNPKTGALESAPGQLQAVVEAFDQLTKGLSNEKANQIGTTATLGAGALERGEQSGFRTRQAQTEAERLRGINTTAEARRREREKLSDFERRLSRSDLPIEEKKRLFNEKLFSDASQTGQTIRTFSDGTIEISEGGGSGGGRTLVEAEHQQANAVISIDDMDTLINSLKNNPDASGVPGMIFGAVGTATGIVKDLSDAFGGDVGDWASKVKERIEADVVAGRLPEAFLDRITDERAANNVIQELLAYSLADMSKKSGRITLVDIDNKRKLVNLGRFDKRKSILESLTELRRRAVIQNRILSKRIKSRGGEPIETGAGVRGATPEASDSALPRFERGADGEFVAPDDFDLEQTESGTFRVVPRGAK